MSSDFTPSANNCVAANCAPFPYEDGGNRDRSGFYDWRVNAKAGITPNATDEYSVNYTVQQSSKQSPFHTDRQIVQAYQFMNPFSRRSWDWPQWDISTLSWLSKTQIGEASYIKTNAYYNTFDNIVDFYWDPSFDAVRVRSPYADNSYGGFIEMGTDLIPMNTLKGAVHWRRDKHWEQGISYDASGGFVSYDAAKQQSEETWSFAVENTFHATRQVDFVTGVSYDMNEVTRADGTLFQLPELEKWNWQSAAIYRYSRDGTVHADVSSRTRFPTLFDRYSTRFGGRSEEPGLDAERATNYEIGISDTLFSTVHVSSAIFYSDIESLIQTANVQANGNGSLAVYNADGDNYGLELSADWDATRTLRVGGNYTYLERNVDFGPPSETYLAFNANGTINPTNTANGRRAIASSQVEGTPAHEWFLYASWKATEKLTLTPSLEIATDRTVLVTSCSSTLVAGSGNEFGATGGCGKPANSTLRPNYIKLGSFALLNVQAQYEFTDNFTTAVGVTNLLDQNYTLAEDFPEPGRQFYATARAKF